MLGEFVSMTNIFYSTEHSEIETWREADSLPYSGLSKNLLYKLQFDELTRESQLLFIS